MECAYWHGYQDVASSGDMADTLVGNIVVAPDTLGRDLGGADDTAH